MKLCEPDQNLANNKILHHPLTEPSKFSHTFPSSQRALPYPSARLSSIDEEGKNRGLGGVVIWQVPTVISKPHLPS